MKIRSVEAELFHAEDGRTDRQTWWNLQSLYAPQHKPKHIKYVVWPSTACVSDTWNVEELLACILWTALT